MSLATLPPIGRILLVDRDPAVAAARQLLELAHCPVTVVSDATAARRALDDRAFDLLVVDVETVGSAGLALVRAHGADITDTPLIATLTAERSGETGAVLALGAYACLRKPWDADELLLVVRRALRDRVRRRELVRLRAELRQGAASRLVGRSGEMQRVRDMVAHAAETRAPLTIVGEAGTGKELTARVVHALDGGDAGPLVVLDCASAGLADVDAVLFGRGDAAGELPGLVEQAYGGTLALLHAEVLPMPAWTRLARVLEQREVVRSGGTPVPIDFRLISTRRERGDADVAARLLGSLRGRALSIEMPPLGARRGDIPALVRHFRARVEDESGVALPEITPAALGRFATTEWPGNVRQLEHAVERLLLGGEGHGDSRGRAGADVPRPEAAPAAAADPLGAPLAAGWSVAELERRYILATLAQVRGNQSRAAVLLGIDRRTLYRKLKEYGTTARSVREQERAAATAPPAAAPAAVDDGARPARRVSARRLAS